MKIEIVIIWSESCLSSTNVLLWSDLHLGTKDCWLTSELAVIVICHFRNVGSRWALEQAKYNLINEYFLVGVTEELEDFIMLLEAALPRFFRGATELYRTGI